MSGVRYLKWVTRDMLPADGLGAGLARLPEFAPDIANLITAFFRACPGERCPWEFVS